MVDMMDEKLVEKRGLIIDVIDKILWKDQHFPVW